MTSAGVLINNCDAHSRTLLCSRSESMKIRFSSFDQSRRFLTRIPLDLVTYSAGFPRVINGTFLLGGRVFTILLACVSLSNNS